MYCFYYMGKVDAIIALLIKVTYFGLNCYI